METAPSDFILVVDDDPGMRGLLEVLLEAAGYNPLCAPDGATALALLKAQPEKVRGCLLDLNLDDCQGEELYDELRAVAPHLAIFPMSGMYGDEIRERFGEREIAGIITKPFLSKQLIEIINGGLAQT